MSRHLLVIGAQRCGTTYLHSLLDAHPDITMARPARPEPKVFLSDALAGRSREWYCETYFAHATTERLLGEKSTSYLEDSKAPTRTFAMLGPTEIVVLLRDPVQRAVSNWRFSTDNRLETRSLETALRENLGEAPPWDKTVTSVSPFAYLERGRYASYLEPWFESFPTTTHIHFLQELVDRESALGDLYGSLGVDPGFRPDDTTRALNQSHEPAPTLTPDLAHQMREYFLKSDTELSERLARSLPWRVPGE